METSEGQGRSARSPRTEWLAPDSNQTSRMLFSFSNLAEPHWAHFVPSGRSSLTLLLNQELEPSRENRSATRSVISAEASMAPQDRHSKAGMGTPHLRCRDIHQSGRALTILAMRSSPQGGIQFTVLIASRAFCLRQLWSMEMNHWEVARKMTGSCSASNGGRD